VNLPAPIVEDHNGIAVVRDDLIPGGTKARYLIELFSRYDEIVYATPAYGGAQLALAYCARVTGKKATLFVAKRKQPHARTLEAHKVGARVFQVPNGYLSNVQSKAKKYCQDKGAFYLEFGGESEQALDLIAEAGAYVWGTYGPFEQVWTAAGSGVLTRGLQRGIPGDFVAVQIGRDIDKPGRAKVIKHPLPFEKESGAVIPFPSCPNYDRKAWDICQRSSKGRVLFWNVLGQSPTIHTQPPRLVSG
jgi:hypothetical protein